MTRSQARLLETAGVLVVALAYSWLLAGTTPFTWHADVLTALGIVAVLALGLAAHRWPAHEPAVVAPADGGAGAPTPAAPRRRALVPYLPWIIVAAAFVAWELAMYLGAPRVDHPTVSSLFDSVARWRAAKAAVVLFWLGLGWALVRP